MFNLNWKRKLLEGQSVGFSNAGCHREGAVLMATYSPLYPCNVVGYHALVGQKLALMISTTMYDNLWTHWLLYYQPKSNP